MLRDKDGLVNLLVDTPGQLGAMVEVNCETDFVARNEGFIGLARDLARHALAQAPDGVNPGSVLNAQPFRGKSVAEAIQDDDRQ